MANPRSSVPSEIVNVLSLEPPEMNHTVIFDGPSTENDIYLFVGVLPDIAEAPPVLSLYVPLYPSENVLLLLSTVIGVPSLGTTVSPLYVLVEAIEPLDAV